MATTVHVVPHTHWDREWYRPFPVFRLQLVELIDTLLPTLTGDDRYAHFQLDGQMAVIDDYLEMRPEQREHLEGLARAGRLTMGPWYTLPDEFLVSGETHVRNLQLGMDRAEAFGGAMEVGYLPDMFGHVAQMPQILSGFGFADAVVWRGVPAAVTTPSFDWVAPDGSTVRAEYLADGYSNGARLPQSGTELVAQVEAFRAAQGSLVGDPVLWMHGTDHQLPQARLGEVIDDANALHAGYQFIVTSLEAHLAAAPERTRPAWTGEMRSGARTNVLMGVASCRVDVKQAAARSERALEREAEPLAACWLPAEDWPGAFFDHAWTDMARNAAHDSICGCSADEVNQAVLHRYTETALVAEALSDRAMIRVLGTSGQDAVAINPTARERAGTVRAVVAGDIAPPHSQRLSYRPARQREATVAMEHAVALVMRAALDDPRVSDAHLAPAADDSGEWVATMVADRGPKVVDVQALRTQLENLAAADPDALMHLELLRSAGTQEVLLRTEPVPGFGWRGLAPAALGVHAVRASGQGITNGLVTVVADQTDGTFSMNGAEGLGRLVDDGDSGDTYNWNPPHGDQVVQRPFDVDVLVSEAGPVRGRIEIVRRYHWPEAVVEDHRVGEREVSVTTAVELHAGEDILRVHVTFDNTTTDHRLRMHFPLPEPTDHSVAECAFGTVQRGLDAEGGLTEAPLPTFPSRRFVSAGGLLVAHEGLSEYELVDLVGEGEDARARELAITLIRCVGVLSQGPMRMRPVPAGPSTPTPDAQMPGVHQADLVLHLGDRDPYAVADEAFCPVRPVRPARMPGASGFGDATVTGQALRVEGAEVTALRRADDGRLELRVVNPSDEASSLTVDGRTGEVVDLRGRPTGPRFDGTLALEPWKIVTIHLDEA